MDIEGKLLSDLEKEQAISAKKVGQQLSKDKEGKCHNTLDNVLGAFYLKENIL